MKKVHAISGLVSGAVALFGAQVAPTVAHAEGAAEVLKNRTIGYVMTGENRAIYETKDGKAECPDGYNDGPREQFKILYPQGGTVVGTRLAREAETWNPTEKPESLPYHYIQGNTGLGLNLDGKVGANDFTSPYGDKGIDNNLYRAIGCTRNFRSDGETSILTPQWRVKGRYNTYVIEITDVDDLQNDPDVTVTTYRGMDKLIADATGANFLPGGTQAIDTHWGKKFIQKFHGKIVNGVLTTDAHDLWIPEGSVYDPRDGGSDILWHDMRFQLKLTPDSADGFMGGYADIATWYYNSHFTRDAHHQSYGGTSGPSMHRALEKLADAYPDPKTGQNTAISGAMNVKFTQVFVVHSDTTVASKDNTKTASARSAQEPAGHE
jgi:hypothetical protein